MNGHVPSAQQIARGLPTLRILWGGIFASSIGMFVASRVVVFGPSSPPASPTLGPMLFVVACMCGLFGVLFPRAQLVGALKRRPPSRPLVQTGAVLGLALTESVALIGFTITALRVPGGYELALFAISWLLFVARFPTLTRPFGVLGPVLDLSDPPSEVDALR
jgi:F0F1-type ATP synthase membrane subunit c/vacuolar-type H+-ATPase subunit K